MLGIILTAVTGQSFDDFMSENIFQPLKMKHTWIGDEQPRKKTTPNLVTIASQYQRTTVTNQRGYKETVRIGITKSPKIDLQSKLSSGGILSTANDLALFGWYSHFSNKLLSSQMHDKTWGGAVKLKKEG